MRTSLATITHDDSVHGRFSLCLAAVVTVAVLCVPAVADVVSVAGKRPTIDVRITGFRGGQVEYSLSADKQVSHPIEEIDYLQITNWPLFNLAEKQSRDGHIRQAASNYERLLRQLAEPKPDELDRRQLIRCRLLKALDQLGQFDRVVEVYIEIIEQESVLAERIRPTRYPAPGSTFLQTAIKTVNAAIKRHAQDSIAQSLARWRDSWPTTESRPAATPATSQPSGAASANVLRQMAEIQQAVSSGQFEIAIQKIDAILKASPDAASAELFYMQGQALLGRTAKSNTAEVERKRAGLAFMRVVIHFPGHALAPECLYHAGEICMAGGQKEQAAGLWSELSRSYPTATAWVEKAKKDLETEKK